MKLIMENWRKYLKEGPRPEFREKPSIAAQHHDRQGLGNFAVDKVRSKFRQKYPNIAPNIDLKTFDEQPHPNRGKPPPYDPEEDKNRIIDEDFLRQLVSQYVARKPHLPSIAKLLLEMIERYSTDAEFKKFARRYKNAPITKRTFGYGFIEWSSKRKEQDPGAADKMRLGRIGPEDQRVPGAELGGYADGGNFDSGQIENTGHTTFLAQSFSSAGAFSEYIGSANGPNKPAADGSGYKYYYRDVPAMIKFLQFMQAVTAVGTFVHEMYHVFDHIYLVSTNSDSAAGDHEIYASNKQNNFEGNMLLGLRSDIEAGRALPGGVDLSWVHPKEKKNFLKDLWRDLGRFLSPTGASGYRDENKARSVKDMEQTRRFEKDMAKNPGQYTKISHTANPKAPENRRRDGTLPGNLKGYDDRKFKPGKV